MKINGMKVMSTQSWLGTKPAGPQFDCAGASLKGTYPSGVFHTSLGSILCSEFEFKNDLSVGYQWRIQEFLKEGAVKQKRGAVTIKIQYFGEKSLESSMKSVSKGGAVAPTSSAVDPPLLDTFPLSSNMVKIWAQTIKV
jgi:hypothetical protein